jgi:hypothetical protein
MGTKEQAEEFLENSRPAIEHIFGALSSYNEVLEKAQTTVEEIERSKQFLSDLFMYRDQLRIPRHPASDSTRRRPRIPRDPGRLFQ